MFHKQSFLFISLLFVFVMLTQMVSAQSFRGYANGGVVASQVDGDRYGGYKKPGLFLGMAVSFPLQNENDLMLELNYIQLGSRKNASYEDGDYDSYLMRVNYAQVPVFYRYNLHRYLSLDFGVSMSVLLSAKEFENGSEIRSFPDFKNFDIGGIAGFNFHINERWGVLLRWSYSIVPFRPDAYKSRALFNYGQYHKYINTSLQYSF